MRIAIFGAGVVGTATGNAFTHHGTHVTYVDVVPDKITALRAQGHTALSPDEVDLSDIDAVFVSVPTPPKPDTGEQDTSYLVSATESIGHALRNIGDFHYPVVVFRCTQIPGMTEQLTSMLEDISDMKAGIHFGVIYNPEYLRAENPDDTKNPFVDSLNPPIVTIGHDSRDVRSVRVMEELYRPFGTRMTYMSIAGAEFQKYVHNVFNATKISFFNEFRQLGTAQGLTPLEITQAFIVSVTSCEGLRNPLYGTKDLGAYNGTCLPKETTATIAIAAGLKVPMPVVSATHETNERMKQITQL